MRILQACPYAWDMPGGVQVQVRQLAEELRRRGHEVLIVAPARGRGSEAGVVIAGRALRVPYQGTVAPIAPSPLGLVPVHRAARAFDPDVLHAHEPLVPSTSMWATLRARAPAVGTFHAHAERSRLYDAASPALRPVWRRLAARTAVSEAARAFVVGRFGDGVEVVPNGVDVAPFRDARADGASVDGRRIVWAGRLDRQKGFPTAVRAFAAIADEVSDVRFVVAGDGADREAVANVSGRVRERVRLLGAVPHDRLPEVLAGADAFVSTADGQESFGLTLVEAMAAGVPVVATDIAGYREVVRDGRDGLLVPAGDPRAVAAALRRILHDESLARRLAAGGRDRADAFSWEVVCPRIEALYRRVLEGGRPIT